MTDKPQEDPEALLRKGVRYLEFGEFTAARDTLLAVVEIDSSFSKAW